MRLDQFNLSLLPKKGKGGRTKSISARPILSLGKAVAELGNNADLFLELKNWHGSGGDLTEANKETRRNNSRDKIRKIRRYMSSSKVKPISNFWRMIWSPEDQIKERQTRWARRIQKIPTHQNSWGFRRGRSCKDCCQSHLIYWGSKGRGDVSFLSMDIENFFPSITGEMIRETLEFYKFPEAEIDQCIEDCTIVVSEDLIVEKMLPRISQLRLAGSLPKGGWVAGELSESFSVPDCIQDFQRALDVTKDRYSMYGNLCDNLPEARDFARDLMFRYVCGFSRSASLGDRVLLQGSPASPAISNLIMNRIDYRLEALAKQFEAFYSRYADDLTFSWKKRRGKKQINMMTYMTSMILEESGFFMRKDKTCMKGPGMRQSVLGYTMNSGKVTIPRERRDRLSATISAIETGGIKADPSDLESLIGEIEYVATAHPQYAAQLRKRALVLLSSMGFSPRSGIEIHTELGGKTLDDESLRLKSRNMAII